MYSNDTFPHQKLHYQREGKKTGDTETHILTTYSTAPLVFLQDTRNVVSKTELSYLFPQSHSDCPSYLLSVSLI